MSVGCLPSWEEGQHLTPHVFQFLNAYLQELSRHSERQSHPYYWGVDYTIDELALQRGTFKIDGGDFVIRDGTRLRVQGPPPQSNAILSCRDFVTALDAHGKPLGVYLGLMMVPWVEPLYTHYAYEINDVTIGDVLAANNQGSVSCLIHKLHLVFENELEQYRDWTLIKIATVQRCEQDTSFQLCEQYIPPCRSIRASSTLGKMLAGLRDLLLRKARELEGDKVHRATRIRSRGRSDVLCVQKMQTVHKYYQTFQHLLETGETHPHEVYALLRQLVGELGVFSTHLSVLDQPLPPYQHDTLWECFASATQMAIQLLHEMTRGPVSEVRLVYDQMNKSYKATFPKEFFIPQNLYYVAIKADMDSEELMHDLNKKCKISADQELDRLRRLALDGIDVQRIAPPDELPYELPRFAHFFYFKVNHHHNLWPSITQHQNLVVYCGDHALPENTDIILYAIPDIEG